MAFHDFEPPSFSLGLEDLQPPSFSLGLDEEGLPPPTTSASIPGEQHRQQQQQGFDSPAFNFDEARVSPKRALKRLRRGAASQAPEAEPTCNVTTPQATVVDDDIEEFSSEEEPSNSQKFNPRSFSTLKPIRTPPVAERKGSTPATEVSIKKTSLGSKEVRFQDVPTPVNLQRASFHSPPASSSWRPEKVPVYDFRDNQIFIESDGEDDEQPGEASSDARVAELLHQRLPHFSFVDDLEVEQGGEPVYIDYRGQFQTNRNTRRSTGARYVDSQQAPQQARSSRARKTQKRKRNTSGNSPPRGQNKSSTGKKGYWLTEGGGKVYVTGDGERLYGGNGYRRYLLDYNKNKNNKQRTRKIKKKK